MDMDTVHDLLDRLNLKKGNVSSIWIAALAVFLNTFPIDSIYWVNDTVEVLKRYGIGIFRKLGG